MNQINRLQLRLIARVQQAANRRAEKQWDKALARFTAMCNEIAGEQP